MQDIKLIKDHFLKNPDLQKLFMSISYADRYDNIYLQGLTRIASESGFSIYRTRKMIKELVDIKALCGFEVKQLGYNRYNGRSWYYRWILADWNVHERFAEFLIDKLEKSEYEEVIE